MSEAELSPDLVDAVLEACGLSARPSPDLAGLRALYAAWCRHVPFDNIRKLIAVHAAEPGPLPGDDPTDFFTHWLAHRVGGTCWSGNGALCALLRHLGYAAHRGVATMLVAPDLPPNHGTVVVALEEGQYVVDASIMHVEPLPMRPGETAALAHPAWGVAGRWLDGSFAINWRPILREDRIDCRIDAWPVSARRFLDQHETTRAWSPFNFELVFNRVDGDGRIGVANGCARRLAADVDTAAPLRDRVAYLVDVCGVSEAMAVRVPADRPTPPPPGSRSARAADN